MPVTIPGVIYALFYRSEGIALTVSIQSFIDLILSLKSSFPNSLTIPGILFLIILTIKYRIRMLSLIRR